MKLSRNLIKHRSCYDYRRQVANKDPRTDVSRPEERGFNTGEHLWRYLSTTHKETAALAKIGPELRECHAVQSTWKADNNPLNRWFLPSPRSADKPADKSSSQHALASGSANLGLPKRTAHGLRSYYVNVLRSKGVADSEIALRIGHKTAGKLIVETYGEILPIKLEWVSTKKDPAWIHGNMPSAIAQPVFSR